MGVQDREKKLVPVLVKSRQVWHGKSTSGFGSNLRFWNKTTRFTSTPNPVDVSNYYYIRVIPQHSNEIRVKSVCCILILTRLRAEENFSSEEDAGDSTDIQHFFVNLEFCAKILG